MSLRGDVLHSLKWLAGARFAGQLITWAITVVVIRILKPSDYGLMAIAGIMIGFAALFREMGLYTAMVQKRDLTPRHIEQAFAFLIVVDCAIYALVFVLAPVLAHFFDDPRLTNIVRVLGIQFPLASVGVIQDAMLSRTMAFKRKSFVNLATSLGNGFVTLAFALLGAGVWALVFGSLAGSVIRPVGLIIAARYWCRPRFSREGMGELLRFGGFVTASRSIWYVYSQADVFIIGKLLGKEMLGFYSIAMQLASLPMAKLAEILNQVSLAAYSSIQHNLELVQSHYLKGIRILAFLSFPVFWGISCIAPELVAVVLGQRWAPAVIPLQLIGLVMPIRMVEHGGGPPLSAMGKPHIGTLNICITLVIMVPAFFIGTIYWGLIGASLAWVIAYPVVVLLRLHFALPVIELAMKDYFKALAWPAFGGIVMYVAVIFTRVEVVRPFLKPWPGLILLVCVGAIIYSGFMWLIRREDCHEIIDLVKRQR